jgi:hypothetical protein
MCVYSYDKRTNSDLLTAFSPILRWGRAEPPGQDKELKAYLKLRSWRLHHFQYVIH